MIIHDINDEAFRAYGKIIKDFECRDILEAMKDIKVTEEIVYVASEIMLESCMTAQDISYSLYGGMPIQIGYCNGYNNSLNAFEYHKDSEINIAVTDMILILGKQQDITEDFTYHTDKAEVFFVPAGTVVEMYATTLHYAPCHAQEEGFKCVVILPKGTNTSLEKLNKIKEDKLLFARNKWLIAHADSGLGEEGAFIGLKGKNLVIG